MSQPVGLHHMQFLLGLLLCFYRVLQTLGRGNTKDHCTPARPEVKNGVHFVSAKVERRKGSFFGYFVTQYQIL